MAGQGLGQRCAAAACTGGGSDCISALKSAEWCSTLALASISALTSASEIENAVGTCKSALRAASSGASRRFTCTTWICAPGAKDSLRPGARAASALRHWSMVDGVAQVLLCFLGGTGAGAKQQRVHHLLDAGHGVALVDVLCRVALRVDHHQHQLLDAAGRHFHFGKGAAQAAAQRAVQQPLHAQVVRQTAIDQVDERLALHVQVAALVRTVQPRPAGALLRPLKCQRAVAPALAAVGIVFQRHRAEQKRHRRRCCHRKRQRHGAQVRADDFKLVPGELETGAQRHVGGADEQLRVARAALNVAKGLAAVQRVQAARQQVRAPQPGRAELHQVARPQRLRNQTVLEILAQKGLLETRQTVNAVGRKVSRNDAAARNAADHIGGVQQRGVTAFPVVARLLQRAQHAKAEGRRPRATA